MYCLKGIQLCPLGPSCWKASFSIETIQPFSLRQNLELKFVVTSRTNISRSFTSSPGYREHFDCQVPSKNDKSICTCVHNVTQSWLFVQTWECMTERSVIKLFILWDHTGEVLRFTLSCRFLCGHMAKNAQASNDPKTNSRRYSTNTRMCMISSYQLKYYCAIRDPLRVVQCQEPSSLKSGSANWDTQYPSSVTQPTVW